MVWKNNTQGGAKAEMERYCPEEEVGWFSERKKDGKTWGHCLPIRLLELVGLNRGLYEMTNKFPYKVAFDIDNKMDDGADLLGLVLIAIEKYFPYSQYEMAVSGSMCDTKTSYHIVLGNYIIRNMEEQKFVKALVTHMKENENECFDPCIYRNGILKAVNQSKPDGRVQAVIYEDDLKRHMVTCFMPESPLDLPTPPPQAALSIAVEKSKKPFNVASLPKLNMVVPTDIVWSDIDSENALRLIPADEIEFEHTFMVARFCWTENVSCDKFIAWNSAKYVWKGYKEDIISDKINFWRSIWNENQIGKYPPFSLDRLKNTFLKSFYKNIAKDRLLLAFEKSFQIGETTKIDAIAREHFITAIKMILFNTGMGSGKTAQTSTYLSESKQTFVWIAPNRALANNTLIRLRADGSDTVLYSDIPLKEKRATGFNGAERLVCCANSLHYIQKTVYDVIVIDEVETFIDKLFGLFMTDKWGNWMEFKRLVAKAKKVILLDAFITTKTIDLFKALSSDSMIIYERKVEPITRAVHYISDFKLCLSELLEDLKKGLKLFIFYPYKKGTETVMSMDNFHKMITEETGKTGIYYNSDIDEDTKLGLRDVNKTWREFDFVITNMVITCGVNYDQTDFDKEYLFISNFTKPRDAVQVSYRPRTLTTNIIKVCFIGKMNQTDGWEADTEEVRDPIYTAMTNNVLVELRSPIRKTLRLLFDKAHYTQHKPVEKVSDKIAMEMDDLREKYGTFAAYDSIDNIGYNEAEILQQRLFTNKATRIEKFMLQKFFLRDMFEIRSYSVLFYPDGGEGVNAVQYAWDENLLTYIKQCRKLIDDDNSVFHKIQMLNNWDTVFPVDVKKTKLNAEIKAQIFKEYKFRTTDVDKTYTTKIIEIIYNTFFGRRVIDAKHTKGVNGQGGHTTYEVAQRELLDFYWDFFVTYRRIRRPNVDAITIDCTAVGYVDRAALDRAAMEAEAMDTDEMGTNCDVIDCEGYFDAIDTDEMETDP